MSSYCKFYKEKKQVSYDNGITFIDVTPAEYRKGELIERDSPDCGYIPPFKLYATYSDSTTYNVDCNSSTTLGQGEVRGHSTAYSSMTSAEIGNCVTSIGGFAFLNCRSLTSIEIPSGVTSIGNGAFEICSGLTSIDIPSGVTTIGQSAFEYCRSLTSIEIPSGVTSIGWGTFNYCTSLPSIEIPNSVTSIGDFAFLNCSGLTSIDIPSGVTTIGQSAFEYCRSLTSIEIPSGVTSIGNGAFEICTSLTSVTVNATTPPTLGSGAFDNTNNCPIYVPASSVNAYKAATNWSDYASRIQVIPS